MAALMTYAMTAVDMVGQQQGDADGLELIDQERSCHMSFRSAPEVRVDVPCRRRRYP